MNVKKDDIGSRILVLYLILVQRLLFKTISKHNSIPKSCFQFCVTEDNKNLYGKFDTLPI